MTKGYSKEKRTCPYCGKVSWAGQIGVHIKYVHETAAQDLFWRKVQKGEGCWLWTGAKRWDGYGRLTWHKKQMTANRVSWELANGRPVPEGMTVMHSCDNPSCVNPAHLSIGSHEENMADCRAKMRHSHGDKNKAAKLTEEKVREILANPPKVGRGGNLKEYAQRYGVNTNAIARVLRGESWTHVRRGNGE